MYVRNVHDRDYDAPPEELGALLDTLASPGDRLWPADRWPRMKLDRPLSAGASGGHGPIRYVVEAYEPGRSVVFRFTAPRGFDGTHALFVEELEAGSRLTHVLAMDARGRAMFSWAFVFRPLHDALLEDALDRVAVQLGETPCAPGWSWWVRMLRSLLGGRGRRPVSGGTEPT